MSVENPSSAEKETIKIIGAGFGRTGTTTLKDALNTLGFKCYHMQEVFKHKNTHPHLWIQAFDENLPNYDLIFKSNEGEESYAATVDWPSTTVWEDLWKKYPHAKIILTLRDGESWYKSMCNTLYRAFTEFPIRYVMPRAIRRMVFRSIWTGTFNDRFEDKQYTLGIYNQHNERVKKIVPKGNLLVLDVTKNGQWDELCQFLDVPVPDVLFPHSNETRDMVKMIDRIKTIGWQVILGLPVLAGILGIFLVRLMN